MDKTKKVVILFFILFVAFLLYFNTIDNSFVYDDHLLLDNWLKKADQISFFKGVKKELSYIFFRSLRYFTYYLDYLLSGHGVTSFHISNIIYHGLTSFLVFIFAFQLMEDFYASLISALVFCVHPVQTECVAYISGRKELLVGIFYLLTLILFFKGRKEKSSLFYIFTFLSFLLAFISKEITVTIIAVCFLLDCLFFNEDKNLLKSVKNTFKKRRFFYGTFAVGGLLAILALFTTPYLEIRNEFYGSSVYTHYLTAIKIQGIYLKQIFAPFELIVDYSSTSFLFRSVFELSVIGSILAILILIFGAVKLWKKKKIITFSIVWYFITISPVSQIIPYHELMSEHYLYLPLMGFALILGLVFSKLFRHKNQALKIAAVVVFALIIIGYGVKTFLRNKDWQNTYTLYKKTVKQVPNSTRARVNYGIGIMNKAKELSQKEQNKTQKLLKKAKAQFKKAIDIYPGAGRAHYNLGLIYLLKEGNYTKAEKHLRKALEDEPGMPKALMFLGDIEAKRENYSKAIELYEKAYRKNFVLYPVYRRLVLAHYFNGDYREALEYVKKSREVGKEINPRLIEKLNRKLREK